MTQIVPGRITFGGPATSLYHSSPKGTSRLLSQETQKIYDSFKVWDNARWQKRTDKINWYVCHPLFKGLDEWTLRLIFAKALEEK